MYELKEAQVERQFFLRDDTRCSGQIHILSTDGSMVFIGMNPGAGGDEPLDQGANRGLLDVLQHPDHHRQCC